MEHAIEVYHGIERMVWVGGSFEGHKEPLCRGQGHFPLDQGVQSPVQPGPGPFQGWNNHIISGKPVSVPQIPHGGRVHRDQGFLKAICSAADASSVIIKIIQRKKNVPSLTDSRLIFFFSCGLLNLFSVIK